MRGIVEVLDKTPQKKVNVVKSVKEIAKLVNMAATPTVKTVKQDYTKQLNYEQHYGKQENSVYTESRYNRFQSRPVPEETKSCIFKDGQGDLSQRLIKVLREEGDLRTNIQADDTGEPVIG